LVFENTIMFLSKATHSAHSPKKHIVWRISKQSIVVCTRRRRIVGFFC
jgi:hypothetical protein